jgi:hypothetical protein
VYGLADGGGLRLSSEPLLQAGSILAVEGAHGGNHAPHAAGNARGGGHGRPRLWRRRRERSERTQAIIAVNESTAQGSIKANGSISADYSVVSGTFQASVVGENAVNNGTFQGALCPGTVSGLR